MTTALNALNNSTAEFFPSGFFTEEEVAEIQNAKAQDAWFENNSLLGEIWFYVEGSLSFESLGNIKKFLWATKHDLKLMGQFNTALKIAARKMNLQEKKDNFLNW